MTADDFVWVHKTMGISRAELCRRIGIGKNAGTEYALGRVPVPLTVALACAAVMRGLKPPVRPTNCPADV